MKTLTFLFTMLALSGSVLAQNPRNVVLYNLTSTGCGPCSCMDSIIRHDVVPNNPRTVVIALHSPIAIGMSHFWNYQGNQVYYQFKSMFEPDGFIDGLGYDVLYTQVASAVQQRYIDSPEAPVEILISSKTWNPVTRNVQMTVKIKNISADLPGSYWYNIFVTENNLVAAHRIEYGCATPDDPGGQPIRNNYINDHVIRKLEFFETGDSLMGPDWPSGVEVTKDLTIHIDSGWVPENCHLNLLVYHHTDSLYKSAIQQAVSQSVTGAVGVEPFPVAATVTEILNIFPNPAKSLAFIHFSIGTASHCTLEIFTLTGQLVATPVNLPLTPGLYNAELIANELPSGIYLAILYAGKEFSVKKFIVQ